MRVKADQLLISKSSSTNKKSKKNKEIDANEEEHRQDYNDMDNDDFEF